jgi:two-component system, OmpR family, response regulator
MPVIPRVLYVDDDAENGEMMTYWIREECGCDIAVAIDGKQAMDMIEREFFDLFLLDYCLPDTTAIQLCEKIRSIYPEVPIAIYSALDRDIDKQRAMAAGANSYLVKPEQLSDIKPFLDKHLARSHSSRLMPVDLDRKSETTSVQHRPRFRAGGIL